MPLHKIIAILLLLANGQTVQIVCQEQEVSHVSLIRWIKLAAEHIDEFTKCMQQEMLLKQTEIDVFWAFIERKKKRAKNK